MNLCFRKVRSSRIFGIMTLRMSFNDSLEVKWDEYVEILEEPLVTIDDDTDNIEDHPLCRNKSVCFVSPFTHRKSHWESSRDDVELVFDDEIREVSFEENCTNEHVEICPPKDRSLVVPLDDAPMSIPNISKFLHTSLLQYVCHLLKDPDGDVEVIFEHRDLEKSLLLVSVSIVYELYRMITNFYCHFSEFCAIIFDRLLRALSCSALNLLFDLS
ncbi:hypothetical protein RND81_06G125500 [Saponaria officinalis]|uniref:Uncharacterized protein n=1 Tax=Saponaria officinalis TaxID=3572 RepID=A0AAW1KCR3_SAPOF